MSVCRKCEQFGLVFDRNYEPEEFLEGKWSSKIWIIGLNPGEDKDWKDEKRFADDLQQCFSNLDKVNTYFKRFKSVSGKLFSLLGKDDGVAHTDLVKCSSQKWPPIDTDKKNMEHIINNCKGHLISQIKRFRPALIVCNGVDVSEKIQDILPPLEWIRPHTAYEAIIDSQKILVALSGFIGRLDNISKRRFGYEIESLIDKIQVK